jgi:fibronectin-binding autotransporter adhesin
MRGLALIQPLLVSALVLAMPCANRTALADVLYGEASTTQPTKLYTIDTTTGDATYVGGADLGSPIDFQSIAFQPGTGVLYGETSTTQPTKLYTINTATGAATYVGGTDLGSPIFFQAIAFQPGTGVLYGETSTTQPTKLYTINTSTGAATYVAGTDLGSPIFFQSIAFQPALANVSLGSIVNAVTISGGTTNVGLTVTNSAPLGNDNLNYTLTAAINSGSATLGEITSGTGSLAPSASQSCPVSATSTTVGVTTVSFTASDPYASNSPQTTTATMSVLGHSNPVLAVRSGNNQTVIVGATNVSASLSLTDYGTDLSPLDVNTLSGLTGLIGTAVVASGGSTSYTAALSTAVIGLAETQSFSLKAGDEQALPGASAMKTLSQSVTLNVLDHSAGSAAVTSGNGFLAHAGATGLSAIVSLSNAAGTRSILQVNSAPGVASGSLTSGPVTPYFVSAGSAQTYTATFNAGSVPGVFSDTITFASAGDNQSLLGANSPGSLSVSITGNVYSGKAQWNFAGAGDWSSNGNWTDTDGNGAAGAPCVSGYVGDTSTFGNVIGSNSALVTIDTAVAVSAITFSDIAGGSYTLRGSGTNTLTLNNSGGTGSQILVLAGSHSITAPVEIADGNLTVTESSGGRLVISGNISDDNGTESLTLNGDGTGGLVLSGTNTYGGGTVVEDGTLVVTSPAALLSGSNLVVGTEAASIFAPIAATSQSPTAVPEPSTLALLGFAAIPFLRRKWLGRELVGGLR